MFGWKTERNKKPRRMAEVSGAFDGGATGVQTGITAGTRIATSFGWRSVGAIQKGDMVLTFDGGLQQVTRITRTRLWSGHGPCPRAFWPLMIPAHVLDNAEPMLVLPRQNLLVESDLAEAKLGDPFALVPAMALEGVHGIERVCPNDPIEVITVHFDTDEVIFAEHGALLFCPSGGDLIQMALQGEAYDCPYQLLPEPWALELIQGGVQTQSQIAA